MFCAPQGGHIASPRPRGTFVTQASLQLDVVGLNAAISACEKVADWRRALALLTQRRWARPTAARRWLDSLSLSLCRVKTKRGDSAFALRLARGQTRFRRVKTHLTWGRTCTLLRSVR